MLLPTGNNKTIGTALTTTTTLAYHMYTIAVVNVSAVPTVIIKL